MWLRLIELILFLALHGPSGQEIDEDVVVQDLPEDLAEALEDIERRDPETHEWLLDILEEEPDEAREFLEEHAEYLELLSEASPELRQALLRQEALEVEVRNLVRQILENQEDDEENDDEDDDQSSRDSERLSRLEEVLGEWFNLRQRIRGRQLDELERETDALRGNLERSETELRGAGFWLEVVLEEGEDELREVIREYEQADPLERLLPALLDILDGEWDDEEEFVEEFWSSLDQEERDRWRAEAEALAGVEYRLERQLHEFRQALASDLEKGMNPEKLEGERRYQEMARVLDDLDRDFTRVALEDLQMEVAEGRERLAWREKHRGTIILLKKFELLERDEWLEW